MFLSGKPFFFLRDLPADIGERVVKARAASGLTRRLAAARAGVDYRTLARIERGEQRPSRTTLLAISRSWKTDLGELAPAWDDNLIEIVESGVTTPGPAIRVIRRRLGISLQTASHAGGVEISTRSRFERGIHAPRGITAIGDRSNGAIGDEELVVTSDRLAEVLGYESASALTKACRELSVDPS